MRRSQLSTTAAAHWSPPDWPAFLVDDDLLFVDGRRLHTTAVASECVAAETDGEAPGTITLWEVRTYEPFQPDVVDRELDSSAQRRSSW